MNYQHTSQISKRQLNLEKMSTVFKKIDIENIITRFWQILIQNI
jgi:hypothetical protein